MLVVPGQPGKDLCDRGLGVTRRDLLRVGGSAVLGLTLGDLLSRQSQAGEAPASPGGGPGWGKAKSVVMLFLQGGPSHLDLWDPKDNVPDNVRSAFKTVSSKVPGMELTELLPRFGQVTDKVTLIRSLSYTPLSLLNHTAGIYQTLTGYAVDLVGPSAGLEPSSPKDHPNFGSNIIRLKPPTVPMLPFVMLPRPLQESGVIGKPGTAGFLGRAFDPYYLYPPGDDMDMTKMDRIKIDDLKLRPEVSSQRLERRARLRQLIDQGMPEIERATAKYDLDSYYDKALGLILSGRARDAFDLTKEPAAMRDLYGRNTFGQSCLLARRLVEAGTRVVEVIWPKAANGASDHSWDMHSDLTKRIKQAAPMFDAALAALICDLDRRGLLAETLVVAVGEFGRSPERGFSTSGNINGADARDHWPYCYTACIAGGGTKRGFVYGKSDKTGGSPLENPVRPAELLATIYHSIGLDPATIIYNQLNQPREMVKASPVPGVFA